MAQQNSVVAAVTGRHRDRKLRALAFIAALTVWLFSSPVAASKNVAQDINSTRNKERQILVETYNATNGPQWIRQWGWLNSSHHHCEWEGVRCNETTTLVVTELHLADNAMKGNMPHLGGLAHLSFLDLSQNELEGSIEKIGLGNITRLEHLNLAQNAFDGTLDEVSELPSLVFLDLENNNFNGSIGQTFGNFTLLEHLVLAGNDFTGALNREDLAALQFLDISGNANLTGSMEQSGIYNLTMLESVNLAGCNFNGTLDIGNLTSLRLLDLSSNDLSGELAIISNLTLLETLNLSENHFVGTLPEIGDLESLKYLDLSENGNLSGSIELTGMETLSSLESINLAGNNLTGQLGTQDFAFRGLRFLDLSRNNLTGPLTIISDQPMLEYLNLARNHFNETLPEIGLFRELKYVNLSYNELTGTIPALSGLNLLEQLDISNQLKSSFDFETGLRITQGITGVIPAAVGQLDFLQEFVMSNNLLTGSIPEEFARLNFLHTLHLENNRLSGTIPSSLNLLEQLVTVALARNRLSGPIPELGGSDIMIRTVTLKDNAGLETPAPFKLCDLEDLDLRGDENYCPRERLALVAFYLSTDGDNWNNNGNWLNPKEHHCTWFGVTCDDTNSTVVNITLPRNGLAGPIPRDFFNLTLLQSIDFNDNDLRGKLPAEIGKLTDLKKLRLSYNSLTGIPTTFENLEHLSLLHLHGNRISGNDSHISIAGDPAIKGHRFISDCGNPTDSLEPFKCANCDICCNALEECQEPIASQQYGGYTEAGIIVAIVLAVLVGVSLLIWFLALRKKVMPLSRMNARDACGEESVYSFVLADSRIAWLVTIGTIVIQVMTFALFLNASSFDNDLSDFVYSWRCPRNSMECVDERNIDAYGWTVWALLVSTSLLEDFANGFKLIYISVSWANLHCFFGSAILLAISSMAVYTSAVYNRAIAVSSTELIVNAVILLFVNDIDELMFNAVRVIFPSWVDDITRQADAHSSILLENVENDGGLSKGDEIPAAGCNSFDSSPNMAGSMTMEDGVWAGRNIDGNHVNIVADKDSGNTDSYRITQSEINSKLANLERELQELKEMQRGMIGEEQHNSGYGRR